jgi:hypothetical protein
MTGVSFGFFRRRSTSGSLGCRLLLGLVVIFERGIFFARTVTEPFLADGQGVVAHPVP